MKHIKTFLKILPIALALGLQTGARAGELRDLEMQASMDGCIKFDSQRAELFRMVLAPPYSCAGDPNAASTIDKSSKDYKREYEKIYRATSGRPLGYCVRVLMECLGPNNDMGQKEHEERIRTAEVLIKKWYSTAELAALNEDPKKP